MAPSMTPSDQPKKRSWTRIVLIVAGSLIGLCVVCAIIGALVDSPAQQTANVPAVTQADTTAASPSAAAEPSPSPAASEAPTPEPSPTSEPSQEPTPAPQTAKVGDRVEAGDIALTANAVERVASLSQFQKAESGKTFVTVDVTIENVARESAPYNPLYFKVKDADGFEYNATLNTGDQSLKSGDLKQGDKARGVVAFEVPESATGLIMSYEPLVVMGGYEAIEIALE